VEEVAAAEAEEERGQARWLKGGDSIPGGCAAAARREHSSACLVAAPQVPPRLACDGNVQWQCVSVLVWKPVRAVICLFSPPHSTGRSSCASRRPLSATSCQMEPTCRSSGEGGQQCRAVRGRVAAAALCVLSEIWHRGMAHNACSCFAEPTCPLCFAWAQTQGDGGAHVLRCRPQARLGCEGDQAQRLPPASSAAWACQLSATRCVWVVVVTEGV